MFAGLAFNLHGHLLKGVSEANPLFPTSAAQGDEVFDETAEADISELMGVPLGAALPGGTPPSTPPPPPTQPLLPRTPGVNVWCQIRTQRVQWALDC